MTENNEKPQAGKQWVRKDAHSFSTLPTSDNQEKIHELTALSIALSQHEECWLSCSTPEQAALKVNDITIRLFSLLLRSLECEAQQIAFGLMSHLSSLHHLPINELLFHLGSWEVSNEA